MREAISTMWLAPMLMALVIGCGSSATTFEVTVRNVSAPGDLHTAAAGDTDIVFAPGVWAVLEDGRSLFDEGMISTEGIRAVAEDGDSTPLARSLASSPDAAFYGTFGATDAATEYEENPIGPGVAVTFVIDAVPGQRFSFASMYAQSNDSFVGSDGGAFDLFDAAGAPLSGDVTDRVLLFDAGTEVNEEPGTGPNQAARQMAKGDGVDESLPITRIDGMDRSGYAYGTVASMLEVRLTVID